MNVPNEVKITKEEAKALTDLQIKITAIQRTVKMVMDEGERRNAAYIEASRKIWGELHLKYGINIENIIWDLDLEKCIIKPKQINLSTPPNG